MSTGSQVFPKSQSPDVLGELLHSLNQPLTSLRCALELSIDDVGEPQQKSMQAALQQTEEVIGAVQLMREYLEAEQAGPQASSCALGPVLGELIEELSTVAAVRGVWLGLEGSSNATLPMPESRLRLALQYLIASMIEGQQAGGRVSLLLEENAAGTILRAKGNRKLRDWSRRAFHLRKPQNLDKNSQTLRRVRLAIASRLFENAGARLAFGAGRDFSGSVERGFNVYIPRRSDPPKAGAPSAGNQNRSSFAVRLGVQSSLSGGEA